MKTWLRLVLITMTTGGGFTGVVLTFQSLFHSEHWFVFLVFLFFYVFVTISGLWFVYDPRKTRPLIVALAIQIPWISTPLVVYKFAAGLHAVISVGAPREAGNIGVHLGGELLLGSSFRFSVSQDTPCTIGINLSALLLLVLLWQSIQTPKSELQPSPAR